MHLHCTQGVVEFESDELQDFIDKQFFEKEYV